MDFDGAYVAAVVIRFGDENQKDLVLLELGSSQPGLLAGNERLARDGLCASGIGHAVGEIDTQSIAETYGELSILVGRDWRRRDSPDIDHQTVTFERENAASRYDGGPVVGYLGSDLLRVQLFL